MNDFKTGDEVIGSWDLAGAGYEILHIHDGFAMIKSVDSGVIDISGLSNLMSRSKPKPKSKPKIKHLCHNPKKLEIEFDTEAECMAAIGKISEAIS